MHHFGVVLSRSRQPGFTVLETLIVLAIAAILMVIGTPAILNALERAKLDGAARQTAQLFQLARLESIKRALPACVTQDFTDDSVFAFADLNSSGAFETASDLRIGQPYQLPRGIGWYGPGDGGSDHTNSSVGFAQPVGFEEGTAVFLPSGTAVLRGAFRLSDDGQNHLEVRIDNPNTAKVTIQKYFGDPSAEQSPADELVGTGWYEHGEDGYKWTWN